MLIITNVVVLSSVFFFLIYILMWSNFVFITLNLEQFYKNKKKSVPNETSNMTNGETISSIFYNL